jgi:alkanesulfonate monooxygenase SsuD/methylene tetrahydromethanopterin reductase-like flavin-dependent oxidoreductase (luciferase family)
VQQPHPPLWIGGNGAGALQRAARLGDGWHPIDLTPTAMAEKTAALQRLCATGGRRRGDVTVSLRMPFHLTDRDAAAPLVGTATKIVADVAAYQAAGVEYLVLNPRRSAEQRDVLQDIDDIARILL